MPSRTPFLLAALALALPLTAFAQSIPLAGAWRFQLDPTDAGRAERWFARTLSPDTIPLPGSTDQAGKGVRQETPEPGWLTRPYKYEGAAWYQRDVDVPESWRGLQAQLFLERAHWETETWVDGTSFGKQNSLSTPHLYALGQLPPGRHTITICVDNRIRIDVGKLATSVTDHTQTNWNGIIGDIQLRAVPPRLHCPRQALP